MQNRGIKIVFFGLGLRVFFSSWRWSKDRKYLLGSGKTIFVKNSKIGSGSTYTVDMYITFIFTHE